MVDREKKLKSLEERAKRMKVEFVDLSEAEMMPELADKIPFSVARQFVAIPLYATGEEITIAMENPSDLYILEQLELRTRMKIKPVLADTEDILFAISSVYSQITPEEVQIPVLKEPEYKQLPVIVGEDTVTWFRNLVVNAYNRNISEVHIEVYENEIKVRNRIDGIISESNILPRSMESAIHNFLKTVANIKLEKRHVPQEGVIDVKIRNKDLTVRLATMPTLYGERFLLRITDEKQFTIKLESHGLSPENLSKVQSLIRKKQGLILLSGPSGSGVNSVLYSIIHSIASPDKNVFTVEDPIGMPLQGVNQVEINPKVGMGAAECVRTIMKHDPDVLMVTKVRDRELAGTVIEATLTGQLVAAGIYARDAIDAITRLKDFGIEKYLVATTLLGVTSQRMVRMVCPKCAQAEQVHPDLEAAFEKHGIAKPYNVVKGNGCTNCLGSGYKGRIGIFEVLPVSENIKELILDNAPRHNLEEQAHKEGMRTIYEDGLDKIARGLTTLSELKRVLIE
ncbi:MAG: GspE/PulE family protein [Firmicutes bacterium]|nr:GspE/PulE family protein [Bacillota bacterium]